jgi:hypothetical protein
MGRNDIKIGALFIVEYNDRKYLIELIASDVYTHSYYCYDHINDTYITAHISDFDDPNLRLPTKAELLLYKNKDRHNVYMKDGFTYSYGYSLDGFPCNTKKDGKNEV